jgi:hypothetical protein
MRRCWVKNAAQIYTNMRAADIQIDTDTQHRLLQLLTFYNSDDPVFGDMLPNVSIW